MIDRLRLIDWGWLARIALCFAVALAGALVFLALRWPLPWFLGAMTACLIAAVARVPIERPQALGVPMRIVLGVAIGTAFTPALLGRAGGMALSLALLVPWTLAIIAAGIPYFTRVAGFDRATALFCAVPGGIADMVTLAKDAGADARTVTLVQSTRILAIMLVLPLWVGWHDGLAVGGTSFVGRLRLADIGLVDAAMLIAIGYLGWWGAVRVRLVGAAIVGPMILSALAHAGGLTAAQVPFEIMTVAQITVGAMLGAQFRGLTWRELVRPVALGLVFSGGVDRDHARTRRRRRGADRFPADGGAAGVRAGRPGGTQSAGVPAATRRGLCGAASSAAAGRGDADDAALGTAIAGLKRARVMQRSISRYRFV